MPNQVPTQQPQKFAYKLGYYVIGPVLVGLALSLGLVFVVKLIGAVAGL